MSFKLELVGDEPTALCKLLKGEIMKPTHCKMLSMKTALVTILMKLVPHRDIEIVNKGVVESCESSDISG